jgi:hypothetical protein
MVEEGRQLGEEHCWDFLVDRVSALTGFYLVRFLLHLIVGMHAEFSF